MMDKSRSQRRADILGMSHGTANYRLHRSIIFWLLNQLGQNICFKCSKLIESVETLSIEHKEPWERPDKGQELFFDLDNIAFSHIDCNRPHLFQGGAHRKVVSPEGMSWCYRGEHHVPVENFFPDRSHWNGLSNECRECRKERRSPKFPDGVTVA